MSSVKCVSLQCLKENVTLKLSLKVNGSIGKVYDTCNNYVDRIWCHIKQQITKELSKHIVYIFQIIHYLSHTCLLQKPRGTFFQGIFHRNSQTIHLNSLLNKNTERDIIICLFINNICFIFYLQNTLMNFNGRRGRGKGI